MKRLLPLISTSLFAFSAIADEPHPFLGEWTVSWEISGGKFDTPIARSARLAIKEGGTGSWKALFSAKNNNCVGLDAPAYFDPITPELANVRIKVSEVLSSCPDFGFTMKRLIDGKVIGLRKGDLPPYTITR